MLTLEGTIANGSAPELLRQVEEQRITGSLSFRSDKATGSIELVAGELAEQQPELVDGRDPVETLLGLGSFDYQVSQKLPALPVSKGDEVRREGSLAVHLPADLMNYCERAGLTGVLALSRASRRAVIAYERGEIAGIRMEGDDESELSEVFAWEDGHFTVEALATAPDVEHDDVLEETPTWPEDRPLAIPSEQPPNEATAKFLRVMEVALSDVMKSRDEASRAATREGPALPPLPSTRASVRIEPEELEEMRARQPRPATVRVVYRGAFHQEARPVPSRVRPDPTVPIQTGREDDTPATATTTRGALQGGSDLQPVRPKTAKDGAAQPKSASGLSTLGWVLLWLTALILALALLGQLPPLD